MLAYCTYPLYTEVTIGYSYYNLGMSILLPVWLSPPDQLTIQANEVHVWRFPLTIPPKRLAILASLLSVEELQRADRFHFDKDRCRFIAAHGSQRLILGNYLRTDPASLLFTAQEYGKPELAEKGTEKRLEFNLSHSDIWGLLAVTLGLPVGVDIERIRSDFGIYELAQRNFSAEEMSMLLALPSGQQVEAFFAFWTRKEAYIKAVGMGLSMPLDHIDTSSTLGQLEAGILQHDVCEVGEWFMYTLAPIPGYAAALMTSERCSSLYCFDF
jgi:4'-phosphopantetheinyl transferase